MSAHTTYTFPKWFSKTPLFEMLSAITNPGINRGSEFGDSFEAQSSSEYSPVIMGHLYQGEAERFESVLNALELTYKRQRENDIDTGAEGDSEFVLKGESVGNWLGERDEFTLNARQIIDLSKGKDISGVLQLAEKAIQDKSIYQAALDEEQIPEDFSMQSLLDNLAGGSDTPEASLMSALLEKAIEIVNESPKSKLKP